jgi:hypothetical protein
MGAPDVFNNLPLLARARALNPNIQPRRVPARPTPRPNESRLIPWAEPVDSGIRRLRRATPRARQAPGRPSEALVGLNRADGYERGTPKKGVSMLPQRSICPTAPSFPKSLHNLSYGK